MSCSICPNKQLDVKVVVIVVACYYKLDGRRYFNESSIKASLRETSPFIWDGNCPILSDVKKWECCQIENFDYLLFVNIYNMLLTIFEHSFVIEAMQPTMKQCIIILHKRPRVQLVIIPCKIGLEDHTCCAEIYQ